jgi:hypothetical protein
MTLNKRSNSLVAFVTAALSAQYEPHFSIMLSRSLYA